MPGDRKTPRAIVGPGATVGFAGLLVVLALATNATDYTGPGFSTAMPTGGIAVLWFLLRGVRLVSPELLLLPAVCFVANLVLGSKQALAGALAGAVLVQTLLVVLLLRRWCPERQRPRSLDRAPHHHPP